VSLSNYDSDFFPEEEVSRQHVIVAVLAAILSIGAHIAALIYASQVDLALLPPIPAPKPDLRQAALALPMKLLEVTREVRRVTRPDGLRAGDASFSSDPSREADTTAESPTEAAVEPPPVGDTHFVGAHETVAEPSDLPERAGWEPRQEILAIQKRDIAADVSKVERRIVPKLERVATAPDIVDSIRREEYLDRAVDSIVKATAPTPIINIPTTPAQIEQAVEDILSPSMTNGEREVTIAEPEAESGTNLFTETTEEVTPYKPIERLLKARLVRYDSRGDDPYGYFRIEIERIGAEVLPVIPKDVILVQDSSASIAEQRLYFCRQGLVKCLGVLNPKDRFNVMAFRDTTYTCFHDWAPVTDENIARAKQFIAVLKSNGETDLYASITKVLELNRTPGRPVVVLLVTDGMSTTGLTRSSSIIGQFTRRNDGAVSVLTMGTIRSANGYLLDLLSYCNRGYSSVITRGRWDIPEVMPSLLESVRRPVLSDVRFLFAEKGGCEVYPKLTENLYLGRPLVLYGRYTPETESAVFQAVGKALNVECDMIFDLDLDTATVIDDRELRTIWAEQRIYHLLGQYARGPSRELMREIITTARQYEIDVPYRERL